jgi:hypothetical protein
MACVLTAVVLRVCDVVVALPREILPHHILRRPTDAEIERIREAVARYAGGGDRHLCFESERIESDFVTTQDRTRWRYLVVDVEEGIAGPVNEGLIAIERASTLTPVELRLGLHLHPAGGTGMTGWGGADKFFLLQPWYRPETLDKQLLDEIATIERKSREIGLSHPKIARAIDILYGLGALHPSQPLYVLGLFSVIESILTHNPTGDHDTLGRQIKTKIALLDRRFKNRLDYSVFGKSDPDKVWTSLYKFRSCIAHGSYASFLDGLRLLKDATAARAFLEVATKRLLRHALDEPDLVSDLQRC